MPLLVFGAIALVALVVLPKLWVARVLRQYSDPRPLMPGTGGEFARHLLDGMRLTDVAVEETAAGDHYDPGTRTVRLSADRYRGKSLTAVVVAAHEVGHAMQDATGYQPLQTRTRLASVVQGVHTAGRGVLLLSTLLGFILRHPAVPLLGIASIMIMNLSVVLMTVSTLPVEFDASFNRAMPLLREGGYLKDRDLNAARRILNAAAYTYVAAALISLIDVARWIRR